MMWYEQFDTPDLVLATDSCMVGAGGTCGTNYFCATYPEFILQDTTICHLELWALIIGLKVFHKELRGKQILVHCDNQAVAELINSGRARDVRLQQGLREVCYLAALGEFEVFARFIPGIYNRLPDFLSRWDLGEHYRMQFRREAPGFTRKPVRQSMFYFSHSW